MGNKKWGMLWGDECALIGSKGAPIRFGFADNQNADGWVEHARLDKDGNIIAKNNANIDGDISVKKNANIDGDISVKKDANIDGNISVKKDAGIEGKLMVKKDATINGSLSIGEIGDVAKAIKQLMEYIQLLSRR
jgi:UDP-3-O-[3-hydroxymyristoyl] glucosamine N-acyltransferase